MPQPDPNSDQKMVGRVQYLDLSPFIFPGFGQQPVKVDPILVNLHCLLDGGAGLAGLGISNMSPEFA